MSNFGGVAPTSAGIGHDSMSVTAGPGPEAAAGDLHHHHHPGGVLGSPPNHTPPQAGGPRAAPPAPDADDEPLPQATVVLRLRGLPFTAGDDDVREFFQEFPIDPTPGSIVVVTQGYHRGEGYVRFSNPDVCAAAHASMNRRHLGGRYIELYASTEGALELQRNSQDQLLSVKRFFVRLRGLPFQAAEGNVREFLAPLGHQAVLAVHMCSGPDGRFNGNAFVEVNSEDSVRMASEQLNRGTMGSRYIEIFESTMLERDAAMNAERRRRRTQQQQQQQQPGMFGAGGGQGRGGFGGGRGGGPRGGGGGYYPQAAVPGMPQQHHHHHQQQPPYQQDPAAGFNADGGRQGYPVVRIRGLPFSANESTIAEFLQGVNIPAQGVHMVYNANERPTGEAFVEVESEADAQAALAMHHGTIGRRYIEVYRSSQGEMQRLRMGEEIPPPQQQHQQPFQQPHAHHHQFQQQQQAHHHHHHHHRPQQQPPHSGGGFGSRGGGGPFGGHQQHHQFRPPQQQQQQPPEVAQGSFQVNPGWQ